MNREILEHQIKTTNVLRRERLDFMRDRHRGGRVCYMAHAKGYVMVRRPGAIPFIIREKEWRQLPYLGQ